ncbi:hypothetical protein HNO89_000215 [Sporosarcina luteola]|nr:hypothetical protein [Sporosarcina luteola]
MIRVMLSEFIKIKRKLILFLIILGPLGVIGLQAANFGLRYDWLTSQYKEDLWRGLIGEVTMLSVPTILIGLTILTSMIANIEHQTNAWKQLVALPVSKMKIFAGKALLSFILLFVSCLLLFFGTIILGLSLRFGTAIPLFYLLKMCFFPFLAAMPFLALQTWLAISMKNQAIPLTTGILGTIVSLYGTGFPDWMPLKWPWLVNEWDEPVYSVLFGVATGLVLYLLSLIDFSRRDVK